jgi:hypothetical protein
MTNTPNDQPLWRVMEAAWESAPEVPMNQEGHCHAAVIRAIADRVVPEEYLPEPDEESMMDMRVWEAVSQRQRIRALLLAEADRAEAGQP